ncbi:uncharacterized protein LOC118965595 [Oncorhynchus mykiss]|uniref:uncharacterized protein LOC118965595 n=1 Tax=Oncorhynchus mykiss TaxID=8022 RepID=UPI001877CC9D|nr:uncharacterized protein LOC118965595 [Oncorhynchus mykiss]
MNTSACMCYGVNFQFPFPNILHGRWQAICIEYDGRQSAGFKHRAGVYLEKDHRRRQVAGSRQAEGHTLGIQKGRWWLVRSRSLRCGRFLLPLWTSRGPRRTPSISSWIQCVDRGAFSTSWSGRGIVLRRGAGFRWRTCWTLKCYGSSTVSSRISLHLVLWVIPEARCWIRASRVGHNSRLPSLFGQRSAVNVTGLLAIAAPFFRTPGLHSLKM